MNVFHGCLKNVLLFEKKGGKLNRYIIHMYKKVEKSFWKSYKLQAFNKLTQRLHNNKQIEFFRLKKNKIIMIGIKFLTFAALLFIVEGNIIFHNSKSLQYTQVHTVVYFISSFSAFVSFEIFLEIEFFFFFN